MPDSITAEPSFYIALVLFAATVVVFIYRHRLPAAGRGVLPAVLLLAGAALMGYAIIQSRTPEPAPEPLTGSFTVPAYQTGGTPFENYMKFPIEVEFIADGRWSLTQYPDSIRGPEGKPQAEPDPRYLLASAPEGSLILQWAGNGDYETVGRRKVIELQPGQRVLFMINDFKHERAYADNTGTLDVTWTCFNCLDR